MEESSANNISPRGTPATKRRRVALACDSCRTRKSRCDGVRPKCTLCSDLGFDCVYTPPTSASNVIVQKEYLQHLEGRVKLLEDSLSSIQNDISGLSTRVDRGFNSQDRTHERPQSEQMPGLAGTEDSVDAMGAVSFAEEADSGFFGTSSNIAFIRHLCRAITRANRLRGNLALSIADSESYDGGFVKASRPLTPTQQAHKSADSDPNGIFALPPHEETLELIKRYFSDTGLLFPYIFPPTFLETYHQMVRDNFRKVRRTWLGLLNMVLAMATITTVPGDTQASTRIQKSDVFYKRSLSLCGNEILRGASPETVQYLLLMGQYLQSTQKSVQAWTVHGLAVKAALQLGLHSREASKAFDLLERESRKRIWYGCVVLDRTLSMTFGRPAAIPDSYVRLELPTTSEHINTSEIMDDETTSLSVSFFNSTITLYKHMWSILDLLYGQNLGCDEPLTVSETIAHVFGIEQNLFAWEKGLPDMLRLTNATRLKESPQDSVSNSQFFSWKFRVILTLRFLNVRILLHRPVLVKFIDTCGNPDCDPQELKLLHQMGMNSLQICADSAIELIDLVHTLVSESGWQRNLLGAWWFSLYYTFNAALVLLGTLWVCQDEGTTHSSTMGLVNKVKMYPHNAISAILKLDSGNRMVDRCRLYLEQFNNYVNPLDADGLTQPYTSALNAHEGPAGDFNFSPLGMEFGEFMMDGDLLSGLLQADTSFLQQ